jgi:hypothetical protein
MTPQQPNPLRCETCEFDPLKKGLSFESCPLWDQIPYGHDELFRDERIKLLGQFRVTTKYTGCTSHSSMVTTEQRIEDAVAELERIRKPDTPRYDPYDNGWDTGFECGCNRAISLLQEIKK